MAPDGNLYLSSDSPAFARRNGIHQFKKKKKKKSCLTTSRGLRLQIIISQPTSLTAAKWFNLDHEQEWAEEEHQHNKRSERGCLFLLPPSNNGSLPARALAVILCSIGGLCSTAQRQESAERSREAPADSMLVSAGKWHHSTSSKMNDGTVKFPRQEMEDDSRSYFMRPQLQSSS